MPEYTIATWTRRTKAYYENLGYLYSGIGQSFSVKVSDLQKNSHIKIDAICDKCLKVRAIRYVDYRDVCHQCFINCLHQDEEFKKKNSESMCMVNEVYKDKIVAVAKSRRGQLSSCWKKEKTDEERIAGRNYIEYVEWCRNVKTRDNFICQVCFEKSSGKLVSHHIMSYDIHNDLRTELSNGITLCQSCHNNFHKTYGRGKNTREQFNEFVTNYGR